MRALWDKAENLTKNIENKALRIVAFWGALSGLVVSLPAIAGFIYAVYIGCVHVINLDNYVTRVNEINKYQNFAIGQLCRMIEAEADHKTSFGIEVRETNPPKGASTGDLWYFTYVKVDGNWLPVPYGAFPYITKSKVGILDMDGEYGTAGKEPHPDTEEIELLHKHH